ncbi:hypothetical protein CTEN210_01071 [Chaetoceros tenuissimus]|uniref:C3H1-type domain-containing protein n=1 Tax=Chaetoceros tenuissimus TaxID=426638 RepID=A0AAD3GYZ7_9STRA|nr:hypothetical protein CTEN210_01071 [Chaetoceros tenuissimus]
MSSTSTTCDIYATRCKRKQDDEFFYKGNDISYQDEDVIVSYIETRHIEDPDSLEMNPNEKEEIFYCCAPHCHQGFGTIYECEEHYIDQHNHECRFCKRVFPNESLLDLHIQERHDTYFQTAVSCNKAKFHCLITDCQEQFTKEEDRILHLQCVHGYPKWFRFHSKAKKKNYKMMKHKFDKTDNNVCMTVENEKKEQRRNRRKEKNKLIPCRFYHSKKGCRRGDSCMFLHDDRDAKTEIGNSAQIPTLNEGTIEPKIDEDEKMDIDMEGLTDAVESKLKVTIPAHISFGRRRR